MKWPLLNNNKMKIEKGKKDELSYKYFDTEASFNKEVKYDDHHLWVRYKLPYPMNEKEQREYKIFCSGWIQYYDMIVRSNVIDHLIYFKWTPDHVSIYLSPAPCKKKKESQSKLTASISNDTAPHTLLGGAPVEADFETAEGTAAGLNEQVDPPPVPKPPPPPRD